MATLFALDGEGPAVELSVVERNTAVRRIVQDWTPSSVRRLPLRRRARAPWLVAAIVVAAGSAAAMFAALRPASEPLMESPRPGSALQPPAATPGDAPRTASPPAETPVPTPAAKLEPLTTVEVEQGPTAPKAPEARRERASAAPPPSTQQPASERDLMRQANALRGEGRYREAERLYQQIARGGGVSAYVALVAAAGIRLDRFGDTAGALRLYQAAQRRQPGGALQREIDAGIARCRALP